MMKILILTGILLGAVLVVGVLLALVAPQNITVRSVQLIKAPRHLVYDQLRYMKNFPDWSPFRAQDPEQKFAITGNDGTEGATFSWVGVKEKSKGSQQVVALQPNERRNWHKLSIMHKV